MRLSLATADSLVREVKNWRAQGCAPDQQRPRASAHLHHLQPKLLRLRPHPPPIFLTAPLQLRPRDGLVGRLRSNPRLVVSHPPWHCGEASFSVRQAVLDDDLALQAEVLAAFAAHHVVGQVPVQGGRWLFARRGRGVEWWRHGHHVEAAPEVASPEQLRERAVNPRMLAVLPDALRLLH